MFLRRFVFIIFLLSVVNAYGESLETIRQQFEIYHRLPGEIEILATDDHKEIDNVLKRTETKRLTVRKTLDKLNELPAAQKPTKDLPSPLFADNYIVPFVHYVTVERAFANRSLQQGKLDEAMQAIRYVYRLAAELAESGSLALRIAAARFRLQMLETAQLLLLHPLCQHEHHELLHKLLNDQINNRETDETIWKRYRDEGKQFFENVSRQGFDKMIAPNLLKELMERRAFDKYEKAVVERFNHDQSIFIRVSEAVIESCSIPFFQRQPALRQLDAELREQRGTANEPVFTLLLLRDVSTSMRVLAQERSGIESAYLALSVSLDIRSRQKPLNFLTGNEYEIRLITDGVMCTYEGNIKPFYVPYR